MSVELHTLHGDQGFSVTLCPRGARITSIRAPDRRGMLAEVTLGPADPAGATDPAYLGAGAQTIVDHVLQIEASRFVAVDAALLPTGELRHVAGTPFDFRTPRLIGARIGDDDEQLTHGKGYDHCWVLDPAAPRLRRAALLTEPRSGRRLEVATTEPGLQVYSGNVLDETGPAGVRYRPRAGVCLETQHLPDSPNRPEFPTTALRPGGTFTSTTVYEFSAGA